MVGAGPHADEIMNVGMIKHDLIGKRLLVLLGEGPTRPLGKALCLSCVDAQHPQVLDQFGQVLGRRRDKQEDSARLEDANRFCHVPRAKDAHNDRGRTVRYRGPLLPYISADRGHSRWDRSRLSQGLLRQIQANANAGRNRRHDGRQVITCPSARELENDATACALWLEPGSKRAHRISYRSVMAVVKESLSGGDHRCGIGIVATTAAHVEVHVAVPRDVKRMTLLAPQCHSITQYRHGADRAAQRNQCRGQSITIRDARSAAEPTVARRTTRCFMHSSTVSQ